MGGKEVGLDLMKVTPPRPSWDRTLYNNLLDDIKVLFSWCSRCGTDGMSGGIGLRDLDTDHFFLVHYLSTAYLCRLVVDMLSVEKSYLGEVLWYCVWLKKRECPSLYPWKSLLRRLTVCPGYRYLYRGVRIGYRLDRFYTRRRTLMSYRFSRVLVFLKIGCHLSLWLIPSGVVFSRL